jgi:hypothetical protein
MKPELDEWEIPESEQVRQLLSFLQFTSGKSAPVIKKIERAFYLLGHRIRFNEETVQASGWFGFEFVCDRCHVWFFVPSSTLESDTFKGNKVYSIYALNRSILSDDRSFGPRVFRVTDKEEVLTRIPHHNIDFLKPNWVCHKYQVMV